MQRLLATSGWGLYCACSWTWCIGMFLPVILLHHFGWPGVLAFAIPNVLGCAAFGYVLRDRARSVAFLERHRIAVGVFSLITLAYHMYFVAWIAGAVLPGAAEDPWTRFFAAGVVLGCSALMGLTPRAAWPGLAAIVYAVSLTALAKLGPDALADLPARGTATTAQLAGLTPVLVLGFVLCPYLDATFHRALQTSPSRHAFGVFGATFAAMLVLTCVYAALMPDRLPTIVVVHLATQCVFTCGAHLKELRSPQVLGTGGRTGMLSGLTLAAALLVMVPMSSTPGSPFDDGIYIRFLIFYGLVTPAYVLLFTGPRALPRRPAPLIGVALLVIALAPLYALGFLQFLTGWAAVAVGVLVVVWVGVWWRRG